MDIAAYYTQQSRFTDPGAYADLYSDLPHDIDGLCRVVQGLIIHYRGGSMFDYTIPKDRLPEIDTCYVDRMLRRITERDPRSLTEPRPPESRFVGCCRDFATLFCSMARYRGVPTRTRVGFAAYFDPHFYHDHEIVECWDAERQRWHLVDPEMSALHIKENEIAFDVHDVPRDQFIAGGPAWQWYRSGKIDPNLFGVDPADDVKGAWFIATKLIQDLAAQNKQELLLWESWGLMLSDDMLNEENSALLDRAAALTESGSEAFAEMQSLYENTPDLRVPSTVMKYSPVARPKKVKLERLEQSR